MSQSVLASDTQSIPTPQQRIASLEAAILASVATGPKSHHEIRKFVQEQTKLDWVFPHHVAEAVNRMRHRRRLVLVWRAMRSIASFALPDDPCLPFVRTALSMTPKELERQKSEQGKATSRETRMAAILSHTVVRRTLPVDQDAYGLRCSDRLRSLLRTNPVSIPDWRRR